MKKKVVAEAGSEALPAPGCTLIDVPLDLIVPTPDNTRVIDEESEEFLGLVESIRAQGVRIPVHVRPHPDKPGFYDLRAGARRFRACQVLSLQSIPAILYSAMSDEDARLTTFQENFDRQGLDAIAEGAIVANLLTALGGDAAAVAARLGRKQTWIAQRANIHRGLAAVWRAAAMKLGSPVASWSARALALIARLPEHSQIALLRALSQRHDLRSVRLDDVERAVAEIVRPIGAQAWELQDAVLAPKAGSCLNCIKRSAVQPDLWDDDHSPGRKKPVDRCLDPGCWREKGCLLIERRIAELRKAGTEFVLVEGQKSHITHEEHQAIAKRFGDFLGDWQYLTAQPNDKTAQLALAVSGAGAGGTFFIKRRDTGFARQPREKLTLAQKREALKCRRWGEVATRLADQVRAMNVERLVDAKGRPGSARQKANEVVALIMALAAAFGIEWQHLSSGRGWPEVDKILAGTPRLDSAIRALWDRVRRVLAEKVRHSAATVSARPSSQETTRRVAALFAIDLDALLKTVSGEKGFTEPKSWTAEVKAASAAQRPSASGRGAGGEGAKRANRKGCKRNCQAIGTDAQCKDCRFALGKPAVEEDA